MASGKRNDDGSYPVLTGTNIDFVKIKSYIAEKHSKNAYGPLAMSAVDEILSRTLMAKVVRRSAAQAGLFPTEYAMLIAGFLSAPNGIRRVYGRFFLGKGSAGAMNLRKIVYADFPDDKVVPVPGATMTEAMSETRISTIAVLIVGQEPAGAKDIIVAWHPLLDREQAIAILRDDNKDADAYQRTMTNQLN